ncbi:hypothetical protein MAIT1_04142 [Magnetofaba australis IT-1]|uniref:FlgO domain-containing protein n=1 Tax=Magnetofaba australis IT-1 TaxID=1434232 RepID=A0A1Y2K7C5_9PROT|nr:hypothetical protein MAIT1_04142 [Magnetofaba australis IT-1]
MALTTLTGCAPAQTETSYPLISQPSAAGSAAMQGEVLGASYAAADAMIANMGKRFPLYSPIIASSFVNMDDLADTSALGRLVGRQMSARFTQSGFAMVESNLRTNMLIQPGVGELALTRELDKIRKEHRADAILAGSYSLARNRVYFHAQLIRFKDSKVMAAQDFSLPIGGNIRELLRKGAATLPPRT